MGKASRKKRAEGPVDSFPEPPGWSSRLLAAAAASGAVLAAVSTYVQYRVTSSGGGYTSFCNVSTTFNCDSVVTSRFGKLGGLPVSVWAIGFYAILFAVAVRASRPASPAREQARADAFALAAWGTLFSFYLATVSIFVLQVFCLLCLGLYAVSTVGFFAAWKLGMPLGETLVRLRSRWLTIRRRPALATTAVAALGVVLFAPGWLGAPTRMTRQEVFRANPQFYDWYTGQPIVQDTPRTGGNSQGPQSAPIQLVEFSDFECPHCSRAHVTLKDVLSRFHNEVHFVFHHFPLSRDCNEGIPGRTHEHACAAAIAAECAAEAGRFEPFANLLFLNQEALGPEAMRRHVKQAGIDPEAFDRCLGATGAAERVRSDVAAGMRAGVRSTPTFFINGRKIEGNMPFENWLMAFAVELDKE